MSVDVTVKQKGFCKKELPLAVILGDDLVYGAVSNACLIKNQLGESEFIAYNPNHIGRGFSVVWNESEKKCVELRLLQPSTPFEITDFYRTVERIASYWKSELTVDGSKQSLQAFLNGLDDMIGFNEKAIKQCAQRVLESEFHTLTLYSALWPLTLGFKEAAVFAEDADAFPRWLHMQQSIDAVYACARFYKEAGSIGGLYTFTKDRTYIFPKKPCVPYGIMDPGTGVPLECTDWRVCVMNREGDEPLAETELQTFLERIPSTNLQDYDANAVKIEPLSDEDFAALLCAQ